jgi:hypothetical protein
LVVVAGTDGHSIFEFPLQPCIELSDGRRPRQAGKCAGFSKDHASLRVTYEGVNGGGSLSLRVEFSPRFFVIDEVLYEPHTDAAVVRLCYCAAWQNGELTPAGLADSCVVPGGRQHPESAVFSTTEMREVTFSLGCFGLGLGTYHQQWALPHYLVACCQRGDTPDAQPPAVCLGLGGLPNGNVTAVVDRRRCSYEVTYRGDLWGHRRGPGSIAFEEPLIVSVGPDWYASVSEYFAALLERGWAHSRERADVPEAAFWPQFDTWGDQGRRGAILERFDEEKLRAIYADFKASGLRSRLFVIDDKWEGEYGSLDHDRERFPHFLDVLDEIRADGCEIGLWTAFPRCQSYADLGLPAEAVLRRPDGEPYRHRDGRRSWYIFDPTNAEAARHLEERARHLIRAYRPKLVKVDFGYEIPPPSVAAPHDMRWAGERLFKRFLDVIVAPMKDEDPSVAVLYYCLTPFFSGYLDQSGADDLWMSRGAYHEGFARRAVLSSWCGQFGVVPYGSSGYDWRSAADIWLDTAIIGTPGVIAPLAGDEYGERLTPRLAAIYNGIARITRRNPRYSVRFLDAELLDPESGPVARSWARIEDGNPVVVVLRPAGGVPAVAPGIAEATCRVAIASLTDEALASTRSLGIVPLEPGRVTVARDASAVAVATGHLLGGGQIEIGVEVHDRNLLLDVPVAASGGTPIEMVQVDFS